MNSHQLSRRRFVKNFALGTAFSIALGRAWESSVLADITPANGLLRVKLGDYPALLEDFGSVRLGINPIDNPIGPLGPFYPILINHETGTKYHALNTACRHEGCIVPPFDLSEGHILCGCHGSAYAIDGALLNGPSTSALIKYPITFDGVETLTVEVPNLGYCVNSAIVRNASEPRLRLDFPSFENVEYEVQFRERVTDVWSAAPFARSLADPVDQFSLVGDGSPVSVYVVRSTSAGFYSVAIKVLDLTAG